jgi:hypothetical protein
MSKTSLTRRYVLAGAPAVAAAVAGGTAIAAVTPDPAIAVVNEYRAAERGWQEALNSHDRRLHDAALNVCNKTMDALFNVSPVTFAGAVGLLEAIAGYTHDHKGCREYSPLEWWVNGGDRAGAAVNDVLLEIASVLRGL